MSGQSEAAEAIARELAAKRERERRKEEERTPDPKPRRT